MRSLTILFAFFSVLSSATVVRGAEAIISQTIHSTSSGVSVDSTLGWRFHLNSAVLLTSLGVYDHQHNGFAEPHDVGVWTSTGTLLSSGNLPVGASGMLVGSFRYVDVPDVQLPVGDYVIAAHFIGTFVDPFSDNNVSLTTHPFVEYQGRNESAAAGFQFPSILKDGSEFGWITSNFQFNLVPEPSSTALLIFGALGSALRRRRSTVAYASSINH